MRMVLYAWNGKLYLVPQSRMELFDHYCKLVESSTLHYPVPEWVKEVIALVDEDDTEWEMADIRTSDQDDDERVIDES